MHASKMVVTIVAILTVLGIASQHIDSSYGQHVHGLQKTFYSHSNRSKSLGKKTLFGKVAFIRFETKSYASFSAHLVNHALEPTSRILTATSPLTEVNIVRITLSPQSQFPIFHQSHSIEFHFRPPIV